MGRVTSGSMSPSLEIPIGLGYVPTDFAKGAHPFFIAAGRKKLPANLVKLPFYKVSE
ncbi:MAG: glycine cleavage T C-terminal barrel domain-containing protein [Bacteroidota bacterium]